MDRRCSRLVFKAAIVGAVAALAVTAAADGYRNPPPTAEGIAKSGANMVFVEDASAISYNPANLAMLKSGSIVVGVTGAKTENSYNNPLNPTGNVDSNDEWIPLPNLYVSMPVGNAGLTVGLGITTPYGQGIDWDSADVYNPSAIASIYQAEIILIDINPTIAFKMGSVSIGIGADICYSELEFDALTGPGLPPTGRANAEGDDMGYGGNIGITWQVDDRQRVAFTYRSEIKMEYEGDLAVSPGSPLEGSSFGLDVTYPNILAAGYGIELTDDIRVEVNVEWLEWSSSQTQIADLGANGLLPMPQNWEDTFTFGVGGDWRLNESWTVRAGYAFIETPIPDSTITPLLPDADRHVLSLGLGCAAGGHAIDVAYSFSIYDDRTSPAGSAAPGIYDIDSDLVGVTYSYSF